MGQEVKFSKEDPELLSFLQTIHLFRSISENDLKVIISHLKKYEYKRGEVIFAQGDHDAAIYIVEKGCCSIEKMGRCINTISSGNIFGEVSILAKQARSATAKILEDTSLYSLSADVLNEKDIPASTLVKLYQELGFLVTSYIQDAEALYREIDVLLIQEGGCSPGYNSVTSFIVEFLERHKRSVFVSATGFQSLVEGGIDNLRCLIYNQNLYKQLEHIPGVTSAYPLREERGARFRCERYRDFHFEENQKKAALTILYHKTKVVVGIGGNGTLEGLKALAKILPDSIQLFFVPATIDSDIYGTECIGQHAGVEMGAEKIRCYMADALTHKRCYIIEMMGARGGHHALHSCLGAGAHLAVLPGFEYNIEEIANVLKDRDYTVIVVAEGYQEKTRKKLNFVGSAAEYFHKELMDQNLTTKQRIICESFSRDIRGAAPNNMDITLAQRLARNLTSLIIREQTHMMPAVQAGKEYSMHFNEIRTDNSVSEELVILANRLGGTVSISKEN